MNLEMIENHRTGGDRNFDLLMKCGCRPTAIKDGQPVCFPCAGIREGWDEVDTSPPKLTGRVARCSYYGTESNAGRNEGPCFGEKSCMCVRPSSLRLAFFEHRPTEEHDSFYCGCNGWS